VPEYAFRLRFNLASTRINANTEELLLLSLPEGVQIRLRTGRAGEPIQNLERAAVLGSPYRSTEEARAAGEKSKTALLYWALDRRLGIDFGDGHPRTTITHAGLAQFRDQFGCPVRQDLHGLDVYEREPNLKFVLVDASAQVGVSGDTFISTFKREFNGTRKLSAKQSLSAEIYSSSFFDVSPRSRFITLVTAVEALLEPESRSEPVQLVIGEMERLVSTPTIDKRTAQSIVSSLQWLKTESIGQAGRRVAARLLPSRRYDDKAADKFFNYCYTIRSELVHRGLIDSSVNPLPLANAMSDFVADLLLASIDENPEIVAPEKD
jgi:hypothetical protein